MITNFTYSSSEISKKNEKSLSAFMLARLSHLELKYFSFCDLKKLEKYVNKSLSLAKECNLTDNWIKYLIKNNKGIIEQKKQEKNKQEATEIKFFKNEIDKIKIINKEDDEDSIYFFEFLFENFIKDKNVNIRHLYNNKKN